MFDFVSLAKFLNTPVLSDVMDEEGFPDRAMLPFVRPLDESLVLIGRARTGLFAEVSEHQSEANAYEVEIALLDDLRADDVSVLACNGPTNRISPWGELLATASIARGSVGCVTDGLIRDIRQIRSLGFPMFHGGVSPIDSKGRAEMVQMDVPVVCAGVRVSPGDIIFGDADGVVAVPHEHAANIFKRALDKVQKEDRTRDELAEGKLLRDVFGAHGVL